MKNINLKAIGWGLFVYIGARAAIQQIAMYAFGLLPDYRLLALISAIDIIIPAMLVGYITAKLSRGNEIKNSLILGVSLYLIAFLFLSLTRPLALPLFGVLG